jgi:hypothetical protein
MWDPYYLTALYGSTACYSLSSPYFVIVDQHLTLPCHWQSRAGFSMQNLGFSPEHFTQDSVDRMEFSDICLRVFVFSCSLWSNISFTLSEVWGNAVSSLVVVTMVISKLLLPWSCKQHMTIYYCIPREDGLRTETCSGSNHEEKEDCCDYDIILGV